MAEIGAFGEIVLVVSGALLLALFGRTISERLAVPSAAVLLLVAAAASDVWPELGSLISFVTVERIAVVALIVILFDGGMQIGWRRFSESALPILSLGIVGTFATSGLVAVAAHYLLDLSWVTSGLIGAAIAPTDPAVTFSVLGGREIRGRTRNDPAGRIGCERSRGNRADDRADRAGDYRRRFLLDGRARVRGRDGGWLSRSASARQPCCCRCCGGSRCPSPGSTRCACSPRPASSTAPPRSCTAPASWRSSSRGC